MTMPIPRRGVLFAPWLLLAAQAQALPLPDSAQISCFDETSSTGSVGPGTPDPQPATHPGQDCVYGRSAADRFDLLSKVGGSGVPGRDYSKIANNGSVLPADAQLGSGPGDWACTRDNDTGLIWEIKVDDANHLRHLSHSYSWYDTDPAINAGLPGSTAGTGCNGTLPQCHTTAYRDAVNALPGGLCGATDWRLPDLVELTTLQLHERFDGSLTYIDPVYFPVSPANNYWSGRPLAGATATVDGAWTVGFGTPRNFPVPKTASRQLRLVRGGQ
ncbi:MAG: DUF1566 domain-containing protein [Xanthomonadales bacterium]|nr:DUF1566 domain-containing protein [Xanthomonadales bacterium]